MKVLAVVQARTGSSRLPGKVTLPLGGRSLLEQMLARVTRARALDDVVVATTVDAADDAIPGLAGRSGVAAFRGHPTDLLDRHYQAARARGADVVVKIPSDCPLVDPAVIDRVVGAHLEGPTRRDYTSNLHPETYPDGSDVEAMSMAALAAAWAEARLPHEREHTTPFLWDQPARFALHNVTWESGRDVSRTHRVVIDYPEDYAVIRAVFDALGGERAAFGVREIVAFLDANPAVRLLNERRFGSTWQAREAPPLRTAVLGAAGERS